MVVCPSMVKMTFTLDQPTVEALKRIATRLQKPQSYVLREAICHYEPHAGQLSKEERQRDRVVRSRYRGHPQTHGFRSRQRTPKAAGIATYGLEWQADQESMIHLDTSVLIDALTGPKRSSPPLRELMEGPEAIAISSIVLFEWLRGPRDRKRNRSSGSVVPYR